jgi:hypothetical protein
MNKNMNMKRISILLGMMVALSFFYSCDKEMPYDLDSITRGALIDVSKVEGTDLFIDAFATEAPVLGIKLQMPPQGAGSFDHLQLVVIYNRGRANQASYIVADNIRTLPAEVMVDFNDVLALVGNDWVEPGESYDFTVNVVLNDGFVIKGWTPLTGFNNTQFVGWLFEGRAYSSAARYAVQCSYNPAVASGSYRAVSATWAVNGPVTITVDPEDQFTVYVAGLILLDGVPEDRGPLRMTVNPADFSVTAHRTVLATNFFGYDNVAYQGSGSLNTCTGVYEMNFTITVDQGSFGSYDFVLTPVVPD